jgi:hypothetical protein
MSVQESFNILNREHDRNCQTIQSRRNRTCTDLHICLGLDWREKCAWIQITYSNMSAKGMKHDEETRAIRHTELTCRSRDTKILEDGLSAHYDTFILTFRPDRRIGVCGCSQADQRMVPVSNSTTVVFMLNIITYWICNDHLHPAN